MEKVIFYITILLCIWSCQQEITEELLAKVLEEDGKVPVTFRVVLPNDISYGSEIVPMSRAVDDTIRANVSNLYKAVIIKKIEDKWFVDTVVEAILDGNAGRFSQLPVYKTTVWDPLQVELRPGTYKLGIFLNPRTLKWNSDLKKGSFVAIDADMSEGKNLIPAANILIKGENYDDSQVRDNSLFLFLEVFTGNATFQVNKDSHLGNVGTNVPIIVQLERRVTRFRYLLRIPVPATEGFGGTAYWLTATLETQPGEYFCEGLDVLGQPYYSKRTSLQLYCSVTGDNFYSKFDNEYYQMSVSIPSEFPVKSVTFPTNFSPFILVEDDLQCTLKVKSISGSSGGYVFYYPSDILFTLKKNAINGLAFERDTAVPGQMEAGNIRFDARLVPGVDVRKSFHRYYELNAVATEIPQK